MCTRSGWPHTPSQHRSQRRRARRSSRTTKSAPHSRQPVSAKNVRRSEQAKHRTTAVSEDSRNWRHKPKTVKESAHEGQQPTDRTTSKDQLFVLHRAGPPRNRRDTKLQQATRRKDSGSHAAKRTVGWRRHASLCRQPCGRRRRLEHPTGRWNGRTRPHSSQSWHCGGIGR